MTEQNFGPLDDIKKAQDAAAVAKEIMEVVKDAFGLDADGNGVADGQQLFAMLKELPALVEAKTPEADEAFKEKCREMVLLIGKDAEAIGIKDKDKIEHIKKLLEKLQK